MTREEICQKRSELEAEIHSAEELIRKAGEKKELLRKELKDLQLICPHPEKKDTAIFGFAMDYCEDCGWQD